MWVTSSTQLARTPTAIALGKFDGVHRGHQRVIDSIIQHRDFTTSSPTYATVVTFHPHPQEFFSGTPRALLTPLEEKVQYLQSLHVDQLVLLPFDRELSALAPEDFVERILVEQLCAVRISVGADFRFGAKRTGTAKDLRAIAAKFSIPVEIICLETHSHSDISSSGDGDGRVSTSRIRDALAQGDIQCANHLLGRSYTLTGQVIQGKQLGRTIGFPTANLQLPPDKFLPKTGVYAVRITIGASDAVKYGVMNIGTRPTVAGENLTVEVHIFDWHQDLYGEKICVYLEKFIRPEQKFPSLDALKSQIQADCVIAQNFFHC
ncbi:riboflavin biosynthesis protein RibF [Calothrix sp. NIES-3974]|nr:riboflavin biosynthesis protein RibF [Calothrix sp. NIES-3974]